MAGRFVLKTSSDAQTYFILQSGNYQTILTGERYRHKSSALNGIESVRENAPIDGRYERKPSGSQWMFNLKAANGQIIGTSERYTTEAAMENGIQSVKDNGPHANLVDET
ncbi:MAG: YegP family protein [Nitrosospira sp.]|nr:YegP family protein [Nitrosospira sp.]